MTAPVCERDDNCITDVLKDVLTQIRGMIKRLKKEAITADAAMIQFEHTINLVPRVLSLLEVERGPWERGWHSISYQAFSESSHKTITKRPAHMPEIVQCA